MIPFVGLASDLGGCRKGSHQAPSFLQTHLYLKEEQGQIIYPSLSLSNQYEDLAYLSQALSNAAFAFAQKYPFFLSFGGDHSSAIGTWSGVARAVQGELGLLWIDAHMDAHTPETSESGNLHGMPLAVLMGYGDLRLTRFAPPIKPRHIALIGVRSFERGEAELLKSLNVRIYYMEEIRKRGLQEVIKEAMQVVSHKTAGYGISFDLDSIDPVFVPAVGTPVVGGLDPEELFASFSIFQDIPPRALEIVEYIPSLDQDLRSLKVIQQLISLFHTGREFSAKRHR